MEIQKVTKPVYILEVEQQELDQLAALSELGSRLTPAFLKKAFEIDSDEGTDKFLQRSQNLADSLLPISSSPGGFVKEEKKESDDA